MHMPYWLMFVGLIVMFFGIYIARDCAKGIRRWTPMLYQRLEPTSRIHVFIAEDRTEFAVAIIVAAIGLGIAIVSLLCLL